MKRLFIIPFALILFSFVTNTTNLDQEKQQKLVWLTAEDWKELEKVSTKGKKTTAVVDFKTRLNIITRVQYKHENVSFTNAQRKKLEKILKKYE